MTSSLRPTPAGANVDAGKPSAASSRVCIGCGKPLLYRSLNTRFDIDYHKTCWVKSEERQEYGRLRSAVEPDDEDIADIFEKLKR